MDLNAAFKKIFQKEPEQHFFAPGRVNLIGEHTDYNGGYVFPCALSFGTHLLIASNTDGTLRFRSLNMEEKVDLSIKQMNQLQPLPNHSWVNYPLGCLSELLVRGACFEKGYDLLFWGDVPAGAGLSSSAALEVVTAFAFNELLEMHLDRTELARIGQASEHKFAGVNCGIMDQFASAQGKKNHAIFLNCDTLNFDLVPVALDRIKIVISNTHSPHKLDSGAYNARVSQCQTAVSQISKVRPLHCLAELTEKDFSEVESSITDPIAHRRARHVVTEVQRTKDAVEALRKGDILAFGQMMNASHKSLRDDYEVTGPELDAMAEAAWKADGMIGSRMTGGGFGGCTVSLVREDAIAAFCEQVGKAYHQATGLTADFYVAEIGDGARYYE